MLEDILLAMVLQLVKAGELLLAIFLTLVNAGDYFVVYCRALS